MGDAKRTLNAKGDVGAEIADNMQRLEAKPFKCDVLLTAVFADARYRILLLESISFEMTLQ